MSTITTLLNTDTGSTSLGVINTNFSNLNTDKIEATQTVAITNKTIDGDLNTLQDIPYSAIKSTSRSGLDTKLVTGTAGTADNIAKWNSDGDLVDSSVVISTSEPSSSSTNSQVPTSKAVYDYVNSATNKKIFAKLGFSAIAPTALNNYPIVSLNSGQTALYSFIVPDDFTSFSSLYAVMIPDTTETITYTPTVTLAGNGETHTTATATDSAMNLAVTVNLMNTQVNISGTNIDALMATLAVGDVVSVQFSSGTTLLRLLGITFSYT